MHLKLKVLFLSAWYPNPNDAMAGLFVRKHAQSVGIYCDVVVLCAHLNKNSKRFEIKDNKYENIREVYIYYSNYGSGIIGKISKTINFFRAYYFGYKYLQESNFIPNLVHVNVLTRMGLVALALKKIKKIPFVITEHWSRYLPVRDSYKGFLRKILTRYVVKSASAVMPISHCLQSAMIKHKLINDHYKVINNVVDNFFFNEFEPEYRIKKRILHVSCFDEAAKNISGLVRAVKELSKKRDDFELVIIGNGRDFKKVKHLAESLEFPKNTLFFLGEKTPLEVAAWLHNSDFFVMFSNYENSPVVISESLCCGKPILSTNVGGISEHVNLSNGILIPAKDETLLLEKMDWMLDNYSSFNSNEIKMDARSRYSFQSVGDSIYQVYKLWAR